jgi:hypothetical protein
MRFDLQGRQLWLSSPRHWRSMRQHGTDDEFLPDRFMLRLAGYPIENASTIIRLNTTNHPSGTYVDFSDTLGGNSSATVARVDGRYRFNDRHGIEFAWYDVKFTGSQVLAQDITWGGQVLPASTQADSELEYTVYKLNYQYSLYHDKKVELGGLAGFHVMRPSANITAIGIGQLGKSTTTKPLPVIGLFCGLFVQPAFFHILQLPVFFIKIQQGQRRASGFSARPGIPAVSECGCRSGLQWIQPERRIKKKRMLH